MFHIQDCNIVLILHFLSETGCFLLDNIEEAQEKGERQVHEILCFCIGRKVILTFSSGGASSSGTTSRLLESGSLPIIL